MPSSKNHTAVSDSVSARVSRALRKAASAKLSAFTLVELIVVIAILAVLATVGFLSLSEYASDARDARTKSNVRSVHSLISMESASTGNSPRYYVVHDTGSALEGTYLFVDGTPVALTGGNVGEAPADSNYTAGTPNWARLKLDPEKFRTSAVSPWPVPRASASSDPGILAGAVEVRTSAGGRTRDAAYFQIAAVLPDSKVATVSGGIPKPTQQDLDAASASGIAVASGLVRNPYSADPAAGLEEGTAVSVPEGNPGGEPEPEPQPEPVPENSCAANPSFSNLGTLTVGSPSSVGQAWTYSETPGNCTYSCSGGYSGEGCATEPVICNDWEEIVGGVCKDPYWSSVTVLLDMEGADNGKSWTNATWLNSFIGYNQAVTKTAQKKSGSSSTFFDGSGDHLESPASTNWTFGTGDFTIECWINPSVLDSTQRFIVSSWNSPYPFWMDVTSSIFRFSTNASPVISTSHSMTVGNWYHIAVSRQWSNLRAFLNGNQIGTTVTNTANLSSTTKLNIGVKGDNYGNGYHGYIDEFRITKGIARYTTNFTPPEKAFPHQ